MRIKDITNYLESLAPKSLQESYDNAGLIVGNPKAEVTGVLIALDSTEDVVDEAIEKGCNLIVAHHPIVFFGLKRLNGNGYVERTVIKAIKNDIALYAIHTNLDNVKTGVNAMISERIGLQNTRILSPKKGLLKQLTVFVPKTHQNELFDALTTAGAGELGNYSHWSFQTNGQGTFKPLPASNPKVGEVGKLESVNEVRLEMIFPNHLSGKVITALHQAHPYENPAYYLQQIENQHPDIGSGMIGVLENPMKEEDFLKHLKQTMQVSVIKHTKLKGKPIKKVAVCGGAGGFLLTKAIGSNADIFITSDYKYHEFFDADGKIIIADIGHYESEQFTKELLLNMLKLAFGDDEKFLLCETNTNPVTYFV